MKKLLLAALLTANAGILFGMTPSESTEPSEPFVIQGGVGIEGSGLYTGVPISSPSYQPKSLQEEALNKLTKQIMEGKMTLEQAKQKLSAELFEQLKKEVEAKKQYETLIKKYEDMIKNYEK